MTPIGPKVAPPTPAEEREAYKRATERDGNRCQRCLRDCGRGAISRDHRKDRGRGGKTRASNLQLLGGTGTTGCHGWKTSHPVEAVAEGWSVPSWADPAEWPARRWLPTTWGTVRPAWVLYDDAGHWTEIDESDAHQRMGVAA